MKAGHHVCIAYNDGRGTIRIRRPAEQPDIRRVLLYPETPIGVFDDQPPSAWPMPSVQFDLRDHEVAAFKSGLQMAREDRGWGVVDEDGRWLVLRTLKPSWFHDVDFSPLEATPDPWPEGMSVAPSFERRGERHTIELQDGTVFDGGVTGAAPTDMTQKEAELWAKHVGGVAKQLPMEKA